MAGVAAGSPNNVSVDANGYLHLKITNNGGTWTAAELFTSDRLGFGTYQWQIDGPIDRFDTNVVLGLFPYGPAQGIGGDGTNEIDIEYSTWGHPTGDNGDWTDYPNSGSTIGETSYRFSLNGGTASTSRFIWSSTSIQNSLLSGYQPVGSNAGQINAWTYAPPNPAQNIPQQALPLGMNLWCFGGTPTNGQNVEVVIRDFQFVPLGSNPNPATDTLHGGDTLPAASNAKIVSPDGRFQAIMQNDGNFVIYFNGSAIWATGTYGSGATRASFQTDGNLVLYNAANAPLWASNSWGRGGTNLKMQNDGNLVIYTDSGAPIWASGTCCH